MLTITLEKISFIIWSVKWGLDSLLNQSLLSSSSSSSSSCSCSADVMQLIDAHSQRETVCTSDPSHAAAECAVCLCTIDAGDEIRRLRCCHVFHLACFDRWVGHGRWTCPLCRNHLKNSPASDGGREILVFNFAELSSSGNDKDNWWLR